MTTSVKNNLEVSRLRRAAECLDKKNPNLGQFGLGVFGKRLFFY
jgi:hypothetical protein